MASYGCIVIVCNVKHVTLKMRHDSIFRLANILHLAIFARDDIDKVRALAVYMSHALIFSPRGGRYEFTCFVH